MKYKILKAFITDDLEKLVNKAIADGWIPLGSPKVVEDRSGPIHAAIIQAMTLEDKGANLQ